MVRAETLGTTSRDAPDDTAALVKDDRRDIPLDEGAAMKKVTIILATAALLAAGAATAAGGGYRGKTRDGSTIPFRLAGKTISGVNTAVPTICLETTGSYQRRSGIEIYQPPGALRVGATVKTKALQPAAMNRGIKATKNYTFTSAAAPGGKIRGTLKLSFSFLALGPDPYHSYIYICTGATTFE